MSIFLQLLVNGLLLGGAYAIISISLTLIFGVVRVVNFAHGELLMIGLYAVWLLSAHAGLHPYVAALPVALLLFAVGALIQRFVSSRCCRPSRTSRSLQRSASPPRC